MIALRPDKDRQHLAWMRLALGIAAVALQDGEAPIGCVLISADGALLAQGVNTMHATGIVTAHAEMNAFAERGARWSAGQPITMVSTLQPCVMCTGAAMEVGVTTIVYALAAPADEGSSRIAAVQSPGATVPTVFGDVLANQSRALFEQWMQRYDMDPTRIAQRAYITQLLALNNK